MATSNPVRLLLSAWRVLVVAVLAGFLIGGVASLGRTMEYASTVRLLILQTNAAGLDPYTALKSTERIAQSLGVLMYTSSFWNGLESKVAFPVDYFSSEEQVRREQWTRVLESSVTPGSGVMSITAYAETRVQANAIAATAAQELARITPNYFGYSVRVQVIDDPLPSRYFVRPNVVMHGLVGAGIALIGASLWIFSRRRGSSYGGSA